MMALPSDQPCPPYSLADIRSTDDFTEGLVVGCGGFGKVYKGHMKSENDSNTVFAIKRLDSTSNQGASEFKAELDLLSRLRHANIVSLSLFGYCVDGNEMIIIYEYMHKGTLYDHLHKRGTTLSWKKRLMISIGAARGLEYLHTGAGTKHGFIHGDMKNLNILLDEDWAAKISDFGFAKVCPTNQSSTDVMTDLKGTYEYLDPKFLKTGRLTQRTDVLAFGVVLFELLSGREVVFRHGNEDLHLAMWAQKCVEKRSLDKLVADEIRGNICPKSLRVFAEIAYRCLLDDLKERPMISDVVTSLRQ